MNTFAADISAVNDGNASVHTHTDTANGAVPSANSEETGTVPSGGTEAGNPSDNTGEGNGDNTAPANPEDNTTDPTNPGGSAAPTDPDDQTDPTNPGQTTNPTDPDDQTDPANPGQTTDPTNPGQTTDPTNPGQTTDPTNPGQTTDPTDPGSQPDPTNPGDTTNPDDDDSDPPISSCEHDWQVISVIKKMDCATNTNGIQFVTCSKCDTTNYLTIQAAHTPGTSSILTEATCADKGKKEVTCTVCGNTYEEEIPATGEHDYQPKTTQATCTAPATTTWACTVCNDIRDTSTDGTALGHNRSERIITEATCTTDGKKFVSCSRCGYTAMETIPSAGGHSWKEEAEHIESTCKEQGKSVYKCSVCDEVDNDRVTLIDKTEEPLKAHTPKTLEAVAPTCSNPGKTAGSICKVCDEVLEEQEELPSDPNAHVYGDEYVTVKAATCTTPGIGVYTCSECKNPSYLTLTSSHAWSEEGEETKAPTCTEEGEQVYTCTNDNCPGAKGDGSDHASGTNKDGKAIKTEAIPATGHDWDEGTETQAPTCGAAGQKTFACTNDNCPGAKGDGSDKASGTNENGKAIKTEAISATGQHTYIDSRTNATCTSPAMIGEVCSVCGAAGADAQPDPENPALGHSWDEGTVQTPATCEAAGEKLLTCTRQNCPGYQEGDTDATGQNEAGKATKTKAIEALGHSYEMTEISKATCTSSAMQQEKCQLCQAANPDSTAQPVPDSEPLGHQWSATGTITTPASCTEAGEQTFTCERDHCPGYQEGDSTDATGENEDGKAIKTAAIPAGHDWGEGEVTTSASCTAEGMETFTCQRDSCPGKTESDPDTITTNDNGKASKTESIQKAPHIYKQKIKPATCTQKAQIGYYCTTCDTLQPGTTPEEYGELASHQYEENTEESEAASCTEPGKKVEYCNVCQDKRETPINASHTWSGWIVSQKATCESAGSKYRYCTVCNSDGATADGTAGLETSEIETDGHSYDSGTITQTGNCGTDEITTYTCTVQETDEREGCTHSYTQTTAPATGMHDYEDKLISATCTEPMKIGQICKVCKHENKMTEFGDPAGHQYTETIDTPATCTAAGQKTLTCSVCEDTDTMPIEALGHDFERKYVAPTCTEGAKSIETCKRSGCGYENTEDLSALEPSLGHNYVSKAEVPATCTTAGTTAGSQCSRCEAKTGMETIPAKPDEDTAHKWELTKTIAAATCTADGSGTYTCERCSKTKLALIPKAHTYGDPVVVSATCTTDGSETKTCSVCGHKEVTTQPKTGHNLDEGVKTQEETCGEDGILLKTCQNEWCTDGANGGKYTETSVIPATNDHDYKTMTIGATCTAPEKVGSFCTACNTPENPADIIEIGEPLGHAWNAGSVTTPATCTENGVKTFTCTRSGCTETNTEDIEKLGHDLNSVYQAPTCQHGGQSVETCKRNGCTHSVTKDLSALPGEEPLDHTPEEVEEVPATCTTPGTTAGIRCSVCGTTIDGIETIPIDTVSDSAHQWELTSTMQEATCTAPGYARYDCKNCQEIKFAEIPASHEWGEPETVSPTCEEDGSVTKTCTRCNETEITTIPKTGHSYKITITKEATCSEAGTRTYTCQNLGCSYSYTEELPATGEHNYQAQILPATCTEPEKAGEFCTMCGEAKGDTTKIGEPLGHAWDEGEVTTPATCTEEGEKTFTCTRGNCGVAQTKKIDKLGHDYQVTETIDATCEENGKSVLTCTRCQDEMTTDLGDFDPAKGHTPLHGICQVCKKVLASTSTTAATLVEDNTNKIVFTNLITVDAKSTKIVEMGILYRTSATDDPEILTTEKIGANGVRVKKAEGNDISESSNGLSFKFNVSTQVARKLSARGYIVIENKDGSRETIYGDVLNGSFNDFQPQP